MKQQIKYYLHKNFKFYKSEKKYYQKGGRLTLYAILCDQQKKLSKIENCTFFIILFCIFIFKIFIQRLIMIKKI